MRTTVLENFEFEVDHFRDDGTKCRSQGDCPLKATHTRLGEAHRQFHDAQRHYSDPDGFTSYLNGCIQSLRNVTFVLQKCRGLILGFDDWYSPWQDHLRNDRILRWIVDARNQIVKKGDLQTYSVANVAIVDDYSTSPTLQLPLPPCESIDLLSDFLIDRFPMTEDARRDAILRIERRWVAESIPEFELLHALAHAYTTLAYLVQDAHKPLDRPVTKFDLPEHLPGQPLDCMTALGESQVSYVRFEDKQEIIVTRSEIDTSDLPFHTVREHYGEAPAAPEGAFEGPDNLRASCEWLYNTARIIMEKDGYHRTIVSYLTEKGMTFGSLDAENRTDKLLLWRNVAQEVERLRAYAVISIGEVWLAEYDPEHPNRSATDSPNRVEELSLTAISSSGELINWRSRIYRTADNDALLGETRELPDCVPCFLEPVSRVWQTMFGRASIAPTKTEFSDDDTESRQ